LKGGPEDESRRLMAIYKLRLFDDAGKLAAVQRLSAFNDDEALSIVRSMFEKTSADTRFDLWDGERRVEGMAPTIRKGQRRR
jgi:hypothetical protein